jgi:predicted ArsR family transcriptional regulator
MSTSTQHHLLYLLKTRGPMTAQQLAEILSLTSMGARKQLEAAEQTGLVHSEERSTGVGRPGRWWSLSDAGHARFPDRHGEVLIQLINQVQKQFGQDGMEQLISARESQMQQQYQAALAPHRSLKRKLEALVDVRSREGYMAELRSVNQGWELVEHHCPICAAATECQSFCRSELNLFQQLLPDTDLQRTEHLLSDGARCVYRIVPIRNKSL